MAGRHWFFDLPLFINLLRTIFHFLTPPSFPSPLPQVKTVRCQKDETVGVFIKKAAKKLSLGSESLTFVKVIVTKHVKSGILINNLSSFSLLFPPLPLQMQETAGGCTVVMLSPSDPIKVVVKEEREGGGGDENDGGKTPPSKSRRKGTLKGFFFLLLMSLFLFLSYFFFFTKPT